MGSRIAIGISVVVAFTWVFHHLFTSAFANNLDYQQGDYLHFYRAATTWLDGGRLYADTPLFFYMPWALPFIIPMTVVSPVVGAALMRALNAIAILMAFDICERISGETPSPWLVFACPFLYIPVYICQWDIFCVIAVIGGYWALNARRPYLLGFCWVFATTKPTNLWLPILLLLFWAAREPRFAAKSMVFPAIAFVGSFLVLGPEWVLDLAESLSTGRLTPSNAALFRSAPIGALIAGGLLVVGTLWQAKGKKPHFDLLAIALSLNFIASTYVVQTHFVQTLPLIVLIAATQSRSRVLLIPIYGVFAASFWYWTDARWNVLFPVSIVALYLWATRE